MVGGRGASAVLALGLFAGLGGGGCRRADAPVPPRVVDARAPAAARAAGSEGDATDLLRDVVDPWTWSHARGASARERALEDIGPFEPEIPGDPRSPLVNTNAHHWTRLVDLAWDRDVVLAFSDEPVDLDGDGIADTRLTRRIEARGGILANPRVFGLVETPEDPRGRIGRVSASTGVLGLREALDRDGHRTGLVGMTCWLCHAGRNAVDGEVVYGLAAAGFDYGLLLATSSLLDDDRVLDLDGDGRPDTRAEVARRSPLAADRDIDPDRDGRVTAGEYRGALGFPSGRVVRARLLLSGPGRQDLTGEFGLDLGVPGLHSARYPGTRHLRQGARGLTNPISVPSILYHRGLALQNWSGSEDSDQPWVERLARNTGETEAAAIARLGLPGDDPALARRSFLLDLRNLGTLGLQQDSYPGLLFGAVLRGRAQVPPATARIAARAIPELYAVREIRALLASSEAELRRPPAGGRARSPSSVARGCEIFAERFTGEIANRQILKRAPLAYAAARLHGPVLAPIDARKPLSARIAVRCADCHSGAPLDRVVELLGRNVGDGDGDVVPARRPPLGRCSHCHLGHPERAAAEAAEAARSRAEVEVTACVSCHATHRDFGPPSFSSGLLLPFDADGDGAAQGDEADDARAGGIGTEPLLAFDVPLPDRPGGGFGIEVPVLRDARRAGPVARAVTGVAWVRVAPLAGVFASAPYLHNGSVPTLRTLLEPAARRPVVWRARGGFRFDTRVAGNRNTGHEFGTRLSPQEKDDLVAFLETL